MTYLALAKNLYEFWENIDKVKIIIIRSLKLLFNKK